MSITTTQEHIQGLEKLEETEYPVYYSKDVYERARKLAKLAEKGYNFLTEFMSTNNQIPIVILNSDDWKHRFPKIQYGMMTGTRGCINYPAENDTPVIDLTRPYYLNSQDNLKQRLASIFDVEGDPFREAMKAYRDSKVVHEFTHVFTKTQLGLIRATNDYGIEPIAGMNWVEELFCEYNQYAFLRRYRNDFAHMLRVSEVLPELVFRGGESLVKHSWDDFNLLYSGMGVLDFQWFLFRITLKAMELYNTYGEGFIPRMISVFKTSDEFVFQRFDLCYDGLGSLLKEWVN
ncbi:hypothetical protein JW865_04195 [Candidatus Bathyarchaeota archaeon]|nr:hypothetical protein [Candidatus Bathyarchaeota archaeon]